MAIREGIYRVLGIIAPVNERLGRLRLNLIPANFLLMVAFGALAVVSWNSVGKVLASRRPPEPQTVETLIGKTRFAQGYVAVRGRLMEDSRLAFAQESAAGKLALADYTWVPLVDEATGKAVLVQFAAGHEAAADGGAITVEGILRPVNPVVARQLKETKYVHAGVPIARGFMIIAGRQPGNLQGPIVTGTVFAAVALGLAWAMVRRNVIFMPTASALSGGHAGLLDTASSEPLLVSGTLSLDGKTRRFFTNMPAVMQRAETGETALLSYIETSSTVYGIKTKQHAGVWTLLIRPGSITEVQSGYVFWGLKKMRAMRFGYVSAISGNAERAVVASHAPAAFAGQPC